MDHQSSRRHFARSDFSVVYGGFNHRYNNFNSNKCALFGGDRRNVYDNSMGGNRYLWSESECLQMSPENMDGLWKCA